MITATAAQLLSIHARTPAKEASMRLPLRFFTASLALCTSLLTGCHQLEEAKAIFDRPTMHMPERPTVQVSFLDQNWTPAQRQWFDHAGQGSELMPYAWFMALEQPTLKLFGDNGLFSDRTYLARFGFLSDSPSAENPDGLPVGFTHELVTDPASGAKVQMAGLTCAACHTGQLEYNGKAVRIEGGTAAADPVSFPTELGYAVALTAKIPFRYGRFERRVLGDNASPEQKKQLHDAFTQLLNDGMAEQAAATQRHLYDVRDGFGRLDALARIGNYVFATELKVDDNLSVASAPVKLPPIWTTSWFSWVQYNYSIQQPMMRNIGESMGVRARVDLLDADKLYHSSINVPNLWKMEEQLSGPTAFSGLKAPAWPVELFGPIDQARAEHGAVLYKQRCEGCHLPAIASPEIQDAKYWEPGLADHRYLKLHTDSLAVIGTDPNQATNWANRSADASKLGLGKVPATTGLRDLTAAVRDASYKDLGLTPEQQTEWSGFRNDGVTAPLAYRARTLEGIWATPPFLHNGSVPNLFELLGPLNKRSSSFYTGSREFDPVKVGYKSTQLKDGFIFNTASTGNSNAGHEFSDTPGKGVIGKALTDDERWAIIEYMKTLN
jgi:mono/diheme cytochrome c family protein